MKQVANPQVPSPLHTRPSALPFNRQSEFCLHGGGGGGGGGTALHLPSTHVSPASHGPDVQSSPASPTGLHADDVAMIAAPAIAIDAQVLAAFLIAPSAGRRSTHPPAHP